MKIDGRPVSPVMVPPKASVTLADTFSHASSMSYQTINDYGAGRPSPARHCPNNKTVRRDHMKIKILCATAIAPVIRQAVAAESELQFNPAFLNGERANSADLARSTPGARCRRASTILTCISIPSSRSQVTSRFASLKAPPVKPCRALRLHNSPHLASTAVRLKG